MPTSKLSASTFSLSASCLPARSFQIQRQQLRQKLRAARRGLTFFQQETAAQKLLKQVSQQPWFVRARKIALYLASDGELNPKFLAAYAQKLHKQVYVPVLNPVQKGELLFVRLNSGIPWHKNKFGILEPQMRGYGWHQDNLCSLAALDVLFLPLVGFDAQGQRLGMGGGFYDKTLAAVSTYRKPLLVGLAHKCQQVESLPVASWDVPLDRVLSV